MGWYKDRENEPLTDWKYRILQSLGFLYADIKTEILQYLTRKRLLT